MQLALASGAVAVLATIGLLLLMLVEGTRSANRFGPDPRNPVSLAVFE